MPWRRLFKSHTLQSKTSFENVYHNIISKLFHGWNPLEIKLKSIPVFDEFTVLTLMFNAIAKYIKSKLQVSIMAAFWYLSDTDQCRIFRQDIWKNCQMPTSIFVGCFSPRIRKRPQDGKARWFTSYLGYYFTNITMEMCLISKPSMSLHVDYFGMSLHKN